MFAKKIGIDLGTASTRVYVRGEGIAIDEPSLAAVQSDGDRVLAVGRQAAEAAERSAGVRLIRPIRDGVIAGGAPVEQVLRLLVNRAQGRQRLFRPEVMICVPAAATGEHRRTMAEAAIAAGARQAWLIEAPLAAAMGLGLPVAASGGHAVCDVGAGVVQAAVISLSGVVAAQSVPAGGDHLDAAIAAWIQEARGVTIDGRAAEELKVALGSAVALDRPRSVEVTGRDAGGSASTVTVTSEEVRAAIAEPLAAIAGAVIDVLDQIPSRLEADVAERGLFLAGGGALLRGLDVFLARETAIPVRVAEDPRTCAVRGTRRALGEFELTQRRQLYLR
ncbi:MAG TPA: rod shape-determining protein [Candidatus Dormibacteraeota bacterium]|nr:rod shape-determining protein [Candidatus Dormibacteraeota bacterium]